MSKQNQKKTPKQKSPDIETLRKQDAEKKARADAAKKKKIMKLAAAGVGGLAVIGLAVFGITRLAGGSGAARRKIIAETEHYQVTAAMFACYFRQCADSYLAYAEANSELSVFDPNVSLKEQEYSNGESWYDQFMDNTMSTVQKNLQLCEAAYAAGFELDDAQLERADNIVASDDLSRYQNDVRKSDLLEATKITLLADQYQKKVNGEISVSDEEADAYYQENQADYLSASVLGYSFPWSPEGMISGDTTDHDAAFEAAEGLAACKTQQEFSDYVYRYLTDKKEFSREEAEQVAAGLKITRFIRDYPDDVRAWIEGGAKRCETQTFPQENQCYTTVYMLCDEPAPDDSRTVDFRVIYLSAADYDGAENAKAFANELREEIEAAGGTSDAFAEQAYQYSEDAETYPNGGLVSGYSAVRTTYGEEISAWVFDRERKQGDMTVVVRSGAVLLAYFEGANAETGWQNQVREDLLAKKKADFTQQYQQYQVTTYEKNYKYIKA